MFMPSHIIRTERNAILHEGEALEREKDAALDANIPTAPDYDIRLLKLIRKIIAHDQRRRWQLTSDQRKVNLCNIIKSAMLLTDGFRNPYNSNLQGYMNANLWNDLAYLSKFNIGNPDDPRLIQLYEITDGEIATLLNGPIINTLDTLCDAEISAYNYENNIPPVPLAQSVATRNQNRNQYRDHKLIQELYIRTAYYREMEQLSKSIEIMQLAESVILGPGISEQERTIRKVTILRALVVLGEAATQKNLTPYTKSLVSGLGRDEWQLFINIRNKLAHAEWDFHSRSLDNYLVTHDFINIQSELSYIRAQYEQTKQALVALDDLPALQQHYTTNPIPQFGPVANPLLGIRDLLAALPTQHQAQLDRQNNPNSFTPVAMVNRIRNEIASLETELLELGCPLASLDDVHSEDTANCINESAESMIMLLRDVNARNWHRRERIELQTNLNAIITYFTSRNESLRLEFPQALFRQLVVLSRTGQASSAQVQANNIRQHIVEHFNEYRDAIKQYRNKLDFVAALRNQPTLTCVCQHRIGQIGKFLAEIPNNQLDPLIGHMPRKELRALRNLIQHGDDSIDILTIRTEEFLLHYLQPIMRRLLPALDPIDPLLPLPALNATQSFWDANKKTILVTGGTLAVAGGFFVMYKFFSRNNIGTSEISTLLDSASRLGQKPI